MSMRLPLILAVSTAALALTGCNFGKSEGAKTQAAACDCPAEGKAEKAGKTTTVVPAQEETAAVTRVSHKPRKVERRERTYRYEERSYSTGGGYRAGYGGRYGTRGGGLAGGVSVSVEETESSSERYRYRETEERWGSRGGVAYGSSDSSGYAYAEGYGRGDRYAPPPPPRGRRYALAGVDRDGYLTWPGKVED